jgi:hypothetical protein
VHSHTEASVKRRDPNIQQLARNYNKLCDDMVRLIRERKAPRGAIAPPKIASKGLFALDVDDDIWQDIGLDNEPDPNPPLWLCDESVREGIKALLEHDRCLEEEVRLRHECCAMREWFLEEWLVVIGAYENTGEIPCLCGRLCSDLMPIQDDETLRYQLHLRRQHLTRLCATWQKAVQSLDFGNEPLPPWGPTTEEIVAVRVSQVMSAVANEDSDSEDLNNESEEDNDDSALISTLYAVDRADAFRSSTIDEYDGDVL